MSRWSSELSERMQRSQRHRLLHGYPMAPLMPVGTPVGTPIDPSRPAIVGVLPHPFCNPRVAGCGFCTFPHQRHDNQRARAVVAHVIREIAGSALRERDVRAVYIGGGTANLTPPDAFRDLVDALFEGVGRTAREVTLEGVPAYFLTHGAALLSELTARSWPSRISMGIQTFDPAWLARMGRDRFGDRGTIERVVARAHDLGATTSGDLLLNLPGQPLDAMLEDIRIADASGLDQICVYHLVLYEGLGTAWSRDPAMLAARPDNETACGSWLRVRQELLARGFVQTTLTNFERADVHRSERRFRYEASSFSPWEVDAYGFGPGAISTFGAAIKTVSLENAEDYVSAIDEARSPIARSFVYAPVDRDLLYLTRGLALTRVDVRHLSDLAPFEPALTACEDARLLSRDAETIRLTPRGMFFADSVTGLLASTRAVELAPKSSRGLRVVNDPRDARMG